MNRNGVMNLNNEDKVYPILSIHSLQDESFDSAQLCRLLEDAGSEHRQMQNGNRLMDDLLNPNRKKDD